MVAKLTAASGGRSSPSHRPATPRTRTVRMEAMAITGSCTARFVPQRDAFSQTAATANTSPMPIRIASSRSTSAGGLATQIRYATAPMIAATAMPLTSGRFHSLACRGTPTAAHAAPNKGSGAAAGAPFSCLANSVNDNVRDLNLSSGRAPALLVFGLRPLGHGPLEDGASTGVERIHLLAVAVLTVAPAGGGVEGAQLGQALLFGRERGLERVGQLGVVHGHDAEARLQLEDLDFCSGEF